MNLVIRAKDLSVREMLFFIVELQQTLRAGLHTELPKRPELSLRH